MSQVSGTKGYKKIALSLAGLSAVGLASYFFVKKWKKKNMTLNDHLSVFFEKYFAEKNTNNLQIYH